MPSQSNWNDDSLNTLYNTKDTQDSHRYLIPFGSLYNIEKQLFKLYYQKDALFVGKPIYFNLWVTSEAWFYYKDLADTNKSLAFLGSQSLRPLTDSEFKLTSNMPLILGIKGLFYWLKTGFNWNKSTPLEYKDPDYPNTVAIQTTENMNNPDSINPSLTGLDYILDNGLGDDYMVPYNDPNFSYHYKPNDHYQYSFLGIDQNHVFLGTRSLRYEMYKLHKYITDNESLLKNLSLTCWYAKGHRKWYVQNPNISIDSVMKNYVDFNNVKTRKLFQPNYPDGGYVPLDFEPYEDRFFDLTILQLNGKPITSEFYLGIQNRRTDKSMWVGGLNTPWRLSYVPSAEFDDLCDGPDAPYWRGMYPYELGNRELSIPLKFSHTTIGNRIGYLAQEITYNFPKESSTEFSHMRYFFKDAYYHKFQGVYLTNFYHIISTDTMLIKLHPGQSR